MDRVINKKTKKLFHPGKLASAFIGAALFSVIGYYAPRIHLQYFDNKNYIEFVEPISFDRKIYPPCDTAKALIKARFDVDTPVETSSRLMRVEDADGGRNTYKIIRSTNSKNFVKAQKEVQTFIVDYKIDCGLEEGVYFFRGDVIYYIKGVQKNYTFDTTPFTIRNNAQLMFPHK